MPRWRTPSWSNKSEYDISAVADGQSTVYVRWTMGTTDTFVAVLCGWNIDDVEIWGSGTGERMYEYDECRRRRMV